MPSHQKDDATTVVLTGAVVANRFVGYDGAHATSAGGLHDSRGVSEFGGVAGEAISVVTSYSYLVETAEAVAFGDFVKPAADGTGRAVVGAANTRCGRALSVATAAGQLIEVEILDHIRVGAAA